MKTTRKIIFILAIAGIFLACSTFSFSRDEGGKLLAETNLPLDLVEKIIENAVDISQVADLDVDLREGYIFVSAAVVDFSGIAFKDVSFHLELFVLDGRLSARMTEVSVAGLPIDDALFAPVNQMIAERLAESQGQMEMMERAELVDVHISPDGIALVWRLKPSDVN